MFLFGSYELVNPSRESCEFCWLRSDHLDQLRHLPAADTAELSQRLHAPPNLLLGRLALQPQVTFIPGKGSIFFKVSSCFRFYVLLNLMTQSV